ncbi:MAG TPA: hypothetical protein VFI86_09790 [Burkholderiales bacterium]|nr:hypothetical protein [Burkholderiales bacterium]
MRRPPDRKLVLSLAAAMLVAALGLSLARGMEAKPAAGSSAPSFARS